MLRIKKDLGGRRHFDYLALFHYGDAVADLQRDAQIMGHEEHAEMQPRLDISEKSQHLRLHRHVERRDRLVRDEHFWMQRERAGNADPLALAAAELMRKTACGRRVEPDEAEQRLRLLAGFGGQGAVDDGAFRNDVDDALARIERS